MAFFSCSSEGGSLLEIVRAAEALPCPALFLSPRAAAKTSGMEAQFAFHLARRAFAEGRNISGKLSNEALLFLARETNFSSAVKKIGADGARCFVLVLEKPLPVAEVKKRLRLNEARKIAPPRMERKKGGYTEAELAVEEMALARVRN